MKIEQKKYSKTKGWEALKNNSFDAAACHFVMAFGSTSICEDAGIYKIIRKNYPNAAIIINAASGEIYDTQVNDDTISLTAIYFEKTKIKTAIIQIDEMGNSRQAGHSLATVEVVRAMYGDDTAITGFYSYGEISPLFNFMKCELHNQTMTITTFSENE